MLFTSAGMQPLVPYFSGAPHPGGRRLVNAQRCLRTVDIDEVGDDTHLTCFEMLGSWSLGDYFKRESLGWTLEWLLSLGIERETLRVTVYPGDDESEQRWRELGYRARSPSSRTTGGARPARTVPAARTRRSSTASVELGNNVFIVHEQTPDGTLRPLPQRNVDVGMGLERITCLVQGVESVYDTDLFTDIRGRVRALTRTPEARAERIVCDHVRSGVFLIGDGVLPANTAHGSVLRRLLRRAIRQGRRLGIEGPFLRDVGETISRR